MLAELAIDKYLNFFQDNLLTRDEVANFLGVHRATVWRWEVSIIRPVLPISQDYFLRGKLQRVYLDGYNRFILVCIFVHKQGQGQIKKGIQNSQEASLFLKLNFFNLRRKQFEIWRESKCSHVSK